MSSVRVGSTNMLGILIRLALTALLLWRVWLGERWAVVVCLALSAVGSEAITLLYREVDGRVKKLEERP